MKKSRDEDLKNLGLTRSPRFQTLLNRSRQSMQAGKGLARDDFWQAVESRSRQQKAGESLDGAA